MLPKLTGYASVANFSQFRSTLKVLLWGVAGLGAVGTLAIVGLSPLLLRLFGSDTGLGRRDMAALGVANAFFFVAMTATQALVALQARRATVWGWLVGLVLFCMLCALPMDIVPRVEVALLAGAAVALITLLVLLYRRISEVERRPDLLDEAGFEDVVDPNAL